MSNHNYSQYSNKKKHDNRPKHVPTAPVTPAKEVKMEPVEPVALMGPIEVVEPVVETVETIALPKTVTGVVANCAKLNVRAEPSTDAEVVCVLNILSEFEINVTKSNADWFHICTAAGVEGYCMRKFVDAHL